MSGVERYIQKVVGKDFIAVISIREDIDEQDGILEMQQRTAFHVINTWEEILLNLPLGYEIISATHNSSGFRKLITRRGSTRRQI